MLSRYRSLAWSAGYVIPATPSTWRWEAHQRCSSGWASKRCRPCLRRTEVCEWRRVTLAPVRPTSKRALAFMGCTPVDPSPDLGHTNRLPPLKAIRTLSSPGGATGRRTCRTDIGVSSRPVPLSRSDFSSLTAVVKPDLPCPQNYVWRHRPPSPPRLAASPRHRVL
jgi:hypothetical protein